MLQNRFHHSPVGFCEYSACSFRRAIWFSAFVCVSSLVPADAFHMTGTYSCIWRNIYDASVWIPQHCLPSLRHLHSFPSSCSEQPKRIIPVASTILPLSLFCAFHHWILFHFSSLLLQFFLSLVCWLAQFVGFYTNFVCAWSVVVVCFQNIYLCCFMMICFYQNF